MSPVDLTGWAWTGSAAGSLYAVPRPDRVAAALALSTAGWWVHVDVILGGDGVSLDELAAVRAAVPAALVEVHVIDLPGGSELPLDAVLAARPQRVVLPAARCAEEASRVRPVGAQLWAELDRSPLPAGLDVDGVLVMLIEPGSTQTIDLTRLAAVAELPPGMPVGVDGGVGRDHVRACSDAGVQHLVSGRALLSQHHPNTRRHGNEESRR